MQANSHTISAEQLLPVLFSLPESHEQPHLPFQFSGGLALPTKVIGFILSAQGFIQMFATLFPICQPQNRKPGHFSIRYFFVPDLVHTGSLHHSRSSEFPYALHLLSTGLESHRTSAFISFTRHHAGKCGSIEKSSRHSQWCSGVICKSVQGFWTYLIRTHPILGSIDRSTWAPLVDQQSSCRHRCHPQSTNDRRKSLLLEGRRGQSRL